MVKSYAEYTKLLKSSFDGCEKMPEQDDVQSFIDTYSLFDDWKINTSDVKQDIRTLILQPKVYNGSPKKKRISSYKLLTIGVSVVVEDSDLSIIQFFCLLDPHNLFIKISRHHAVSTDAYSEISCLRNFRSDFDFFIAVVVKKLTGSCVHIATITGQFCGAKRTRSGATGRFGAFSLIGILSKLSTILAENEIGIFAVSTYNTDYILVKSENFEKAMSVLEEQGYRVV